ncbi:hypothetical protein NYE67_20745 [Solibacillus sp. FSL W8-0474]|uniref:hypothetical protein n=1 Tax=Solibacillus sp. FSL W8-0474 TaxID=2975336 RepID=UPI0030F7EE08
MSEPLMIRPRLPGGGFGAPVKAFDKEKTPLELLQKENESLKQELERTDRMLMEFIEHMMSGGGM